MIRFFFSLVFFASVILMPWYVTVPLGIMLMILFGAYAEAIIGGILLDGMFGTGIAVLAGISYLYTLLFSGLSLCAFVLRRALLE